MEWKIFTDACLSSGRGERNGACAHVMVGPNSEREEGKSLEQSSCPVRLELLAVVKAIDALLEVSQCTSIINVQLYCDAKYVRSGIRVLMGVPDQKKHVPETNKDVWKRMRAFISKVRIECVDIQSNARTKERFPEYKHCHLMARKLAMTKDKLDGAADECEA